MSSTTFFISGGGVVVEVTVEEVSSADGFTDLKFTYEVTSNKIADIRGVFFHVNESLIDVDDLSVVSGDDVTDYQFAENSVSDLGNGANMEGVSEGPFDVGIEIGTPGASPDDIQMTMFTLSLDGGDLTLDALAGMDFGVRLNSVGAPNSPRDGSLKLVDEMPLVPTVDGPITLIVEEEDAGLGLGGNDDGTPNPEDEDNGGLGNTTNMDQGTLTFTAGTLALTSFVFGDVSGLSQDTDGNAATDELFWLRVSDILIKGYLDAGMTMEAVQIDLIAPGNIPAMSSGDVTVKVTLRDNLIHEDTLVDIEEVISLGLVKVVASDGVHTVEGVVNIKEIDDVPIADLTDQGGAIVVDETDGEDVPPEIDPPGGDLGSVTVLAAALFSDTSSFGADGPAASDSTVYSLVLNNTVTSLVDTLSGEGIVLSEAGGVISGKTDTTGAIVFTVSINGSGDVTLTQERAVVHNDPNDPDEAGASAAFLGTGFIGLQVEVTDDDGDSDTAEIDIGDQIAFEDDGPTAALSDNGGMIVVDETDGEDVPPEIDPLGGNLGSVTVLAAALFTDTSVFGSDGPLDTNHNGVPDAGATVYSLEIGSAGAITNIKDTATDNFVVLFDNGGVIEGWTLPGGAAGGGDKVFEFSIDSSSGDATLTQFRAVVHGNPLDPDESATPVVLDANHIDLKVTVTDGDFDTDVAEIDIGNQIAFEDDGPEIGPIDNGTVAFTAGSMVMNPLDFDPGSDGPAATDPLVITDFTDLDGFDEVLSNGDKTLTYSLDGTPFFQLEIDSATDKYVFTVLEDPPLDTFEVGSAFNPGPPVEEIKVAAENAEFITFDGTIDDGDDPDNGEDFLNPDQLGFGVFQGQSSNINPFQGFNATFTAPDMTTPLEVSALKFKVDQTGNTDHVIIDWEVQLAGGGTESGTGRIELQKGNNAEFVIIGISEVATPADSGSFVVSGEFTSMDLVFRYDDGDPDSRESVRVEDFAFIDQAVPPDEVLQFTVEGTDGDGDSVDDTFQIGIDGDGGGVVFPPETLALSSTEPLVDEFDVFITDDGGALV